MDEATETRVADEPEPAHQAEDEAEEGLWPAFRKRMISWRTMPVGLRVATGVGIAQLLAAGLFIALLRQVGSPVGMGVQDGHALVMPAPAFWVGLTFVIVSLSYIMAGALRMRWSARVVALAGLSLLVLFQPFTGGYAVYRWAMVALLWLWAGLLAVVEVDAARLRWLTPVARRLHAARARVISGRGGALPIVTLVFMALWQVALLAPLLAASGWMRDTASGAFQLSVEVQLQALALALTPALFLAGSDFAELGDLIGEAAARGAESWMEGRTRLSRRGTLGATWLTLGLTAALALTIAVANRPRYATLTNTLLGYAGPLLLAGIAALALYGLLRWGQASRWTPTRLSGWALPLAALLYMALTWTGSAALASASSRQTLAGGGLLDYTVYHAQAGLPTFSIPYPNDWTVNTTQSGARETGNDQALVTFNGVKQALPGFALVMATQAAHPDNTSVRANLSQVIASIKSADLVMGPVIVGTDGPWLTERFTFLNASGASNASAAISGEGWARAQGGYDWAIVGLNSPVFQPLLDPVYQAMASGWRPNDSAQTPQQMLDAQDAARQATVVRDAALYLGALPLALGLGLGAWLIWLARRKGAIWGGAGLFAAAMGLYAAASTAPVLLSAAGVPIGGLWSLYLDIPTLQLVVALATLALVAWVALFRRDNRDWLGLTRLALALNAGLFFIALMFNLYDAAIGLSKASAEQPLSWVEGLIVLVALGWDLLMSGESFTNGESAGTPRHSRVLLYLGYITLTATLVMFFSSQRYGAALAAPGGPGFESFFESEPWPQRGLESLGVPLVVTTFALALLAWLSAQRGRRARAAAGVATEAVEQADSGGDVS